MQPPKKYPGKQPFFLRFNIKAWRLFSEVKQVIYWMLKPWYNKPLMSTGANSVGVIDFWIIKLSLIQ
jgi:hypothetical protein